MKTIRLTEQDLELIVKKVLKEQRAIPAATRGQKGNEIAKIQQALLEKGYNLGTSGPNKNGVDGNFGPRTQKAIKDFQIRMKLTPTGALDQQTRNYLFIGTTGGLFTGTGLFGTGPIPKTTKVQNKEKTEKTNDRCIAISEAECKKISPTKQVQISSGSETRCSAYMVKCLSQYDNELGRGNAWDLFNAVKNGGSVKYNAFTNGEVNWNNIWSQLTKNKVTKSICQKHASQDDADAKVNSPVPSIVTNNVPKTSNITLNSLQLGDIVGLYHKNSSNKGMAFCQRALKRGLDEKGNVSDKDPFTFNSHVGFVGAIKNGVPIIIHNVHGSHIATPATKMLNKNSEDMIVWVVSDNDVASAIQKEKPKSPPFQPYYASR